MSDEQSKGLTIFQKIDLYRKLSLYPAITLMVFTRRKLGFRTMSPNWLISMTVILMVVAAVFSSGAKPYPSAIIIYALLMLGLGTLQRWLRWWEICRGERWHSYSGGISYLEYLPWPEFFRRERRVVRYVEPILLMFMGPVIAAVLSRSLGVWVTFAGFAVLVNEATIYDASVNQALDTLDGMLESEVQTENVKFFQGKRPDQLPPSIEETAGIPTGLAADIQRQVELRRARNTNKPKIAPQESPVNAGELEP